MEHIGRNQGFGEPPWCRSFGLSRFPATPTLVSITMHYLLIYDLADDYITRRAAYRREHLELARQAHARGELVLGGALADPADAAVLLFKGSSPEVAEAFAQADPYVRNGLVKSWRVRVWTTVVGDDAAVRVTPE